MASVKLKLKTSQKLKDGSHPIILQVLKDNKKAIITLGLSCVKKDWNTSTNLPKNRRLSIICQKQLLELEELLYEGIENQWDAKKIVNVFGGKDTKELMFFKYYKSIKFNDKLGKSTTMNDDTKLKKFKTFLQKDDISFSDISFDLLSGYKKYLEEQQITSAYIYLGIVRQVYNHAVENDKFLPKRNPMKKFLFKKQVRQTSNRNLEMDQVRDLFALEFERKIGSLKLERVADYWKFCFLMRGINFVEMAVMRPEDVKGEYFEFTREKLKTRIASKQKIKIVPEAREIINKYLTKGNEYVFPILANGINKDRSEKEFRFYLNELTAANYSLKKIGKILGLDFNLSTMSARYTFINLAKRNEVPFLYLQELIGHKTQSTTDIYLDVFPQSKIDMYHQQVIDSVFSELDQKMIS